MPEGACTTRSGRSVKVHFHETVATKLQEGAHDKERNPEEACLLEGVVTKSPKVSEANEQRPNTLKAGATQL